MNARDLSNRLSDLLRREHSALAEFLVALSDFDAKRVWVELGYSSLFAYLHRELRLSKGAAFYRKTAAELIQRFPEIVGPLEEGRICLTVVCELAKVLAPENREQVIPRFFCLSKDEARAVVAELKPMERPPRREVVTRIQVAAASLEAPATAMSPAAGFPAEHLDAKVPAPIVNAPISRPEPPTFKPLTAYLRRMYLTVSSRFEAKVAEARNALSHSHPGANTEAILEAALDLLLDRAAKRRGLVEKPRRERRPSKSDHIPAEVKRAVWLRDGGCCQWSLENGGICGSRYRVQYDHIVPEALGGKPTITNLRLLCGRHNLLAARRIFGDRWMDRYAPDQAAARVEQERRASSAASVAEVVPANSPRPAPP